MILADPKKGKYMSNDRMSLEDARAFVAAMRIISVGIRRQKRKAGAYPSASTALDIIANDQKNPDYINYHISNAKDILKRYVEIFSKDNSWRQEVHDIIENTSKGRLKYLIFWHYKISHLHWKKDAKIRHAEEAIKYITALNYASKWKNIEVHKAEEKAQMKRDPDSDLKFILMLNKTFASNRMKKVLLFGIVVMVYTLYRNNWDFSEAEFWLVVEAFFIFYAYLHIYGSAATITESEYYEITGSTDSEGNHRCAWCGGRGIWRKSEYKSNEVECHCSKCRRLLWTESK